MSRLVMFSLLLAGCAAPAVLPVMDGNGGLAGTYDPVESLLSLDVDGAEARTSTGEQAPLDLGEGVLTHDLAPGDTVTVLDADGAVLESFVVGEPDADTADVDSRYAACRLL
ncbi:MAG: hypothetical protein ABMA64_14215 [Myxococcota bacterium]